ncbi:hypothetical protein Arub01_43420 [Actinomadura rubrobrunea]|uniref:Uncharacterized protein n=1 Tax=Actinomadura rubrobrunea TaxID=115335 RepID=A0A9W6Q097_9ACTN|nr:hypothetical protein [Actinomadura rubrobrunea]GLW66098.1 hypothetical protein Arub01_43420 [Actinomadura rubrobrunea]
MVIYIAAAAAAFSLLPAASPDVLVSYQKSGGFAGVRETVVVHRDGRVVTGAGRTAEFTLDRADLARIRRAVGGVTTRTSSRRWCDVPDHFTYTLAARGWRATRCHRLPDDWRPAVTRLEALLRDSARS